jgi:dienelactone hydrolase
VSGDLQFQADTDSLIDGVDDDGAIATSDIDDVSDRGNVDAVTDTEPPLDGVTTVDVVSDLGTDVAPEIQDVEQPSDLVVDSDSTGLDAVSEDNVVADVVVDQGFDLATLDPGGECGGPCPVLPDPGTSAGPAGTTASAELVVGTGLFPDKTTMTIYLPEGPGPFPVIVFHHGFQLGTDQYVSYGQHLASWGYVVVMPQMPGGLIGGPNHRELAVYLQKVLDWVGQNASVVDGPFAGKADASHIGLAGHSMGGKISMLTASQDARPRAIFGIDPVDAAGSPLPVSATDYPSVTPELMPRIMVPLGLLGELTNASCTGFMCQACAPAADNFQQYYENAVAPALQIEIVGANHMSFVDNPDCGLTCSVCPAGTDDHATTQLLTRRSMTAFFNVFLRGEDAYRSYLTGVDMAVDVAANLVITASKNGF